MKTKKNINVTRAEVELLLQITERHIDGCESIFMLGSILDTSRMRVLEKKIEKLNVIKDKLNELLTK